MTNVIRSVWTQLAQITVLCGLIAATGASIDYNRGGYDALSFVSIAALIVTAVAFFVWLIWFIYIVSTKKLLLPMNPKGYRILDEIDLWLFVYWIIASVFKIATGAWVVPVMAIIWLVSCSIAWKYRKP